MNKKKSKALAFLLAASLLVPSANGIVSAAELENTTTINQVVSEKDSQGVIKVGAETFTDLVEAVKKAKESNENTITISGTIDVSDKSDINIAGLNLIGENNAKIININTNNRLFYVTKNENPSNCITKIEGITFEYDGGYTDLIYHTAGSLEIYNCIFNGINNKSILNLIRAEGENNNIKFENNTVNANCRACITGINGGSSIKNNIFNMMQERVFEDEKDRTGVLSTTVKNNTLEITGNTFKNANRAIAVDNSTVDGNAFTIENNKFIDTRFAFEIDIRENGNNNGKKYNISNNYFEFGGKVTSPKIQDSEIKGEKRFQYASGIGDTNSSEIVLEADDKRVDVYPYYSQLNEKGEIVESSKVEEGLAKVGDKSFNSISAAIEEAKKSNNAIELQRDFELVEKINIGEKENITITSSNKSIINLMGTDLINIAKGGSLTLENVELRANKDAINYIVQSGDLTIKNCNITATKNVKGITNIVKAGVGVTDVALTLKDSNITVNARGGFVAVGSGSEITGNTFNFINEEYQVKEGQRTGVISLIAKGENGKVNISNNTFMNANRVIGVDWSNMKGENLTIKNNKFIDTRYAFEVGTDDKDNKGKSYDISGNYYKYKNEQAGPLRIEDASANGSHLGENNPTELKIKDETPLNIVVGPYYTVKDENGNLSNPAHAGVATVNGKDYARLEKAIRAAKPGETVKLVSDITVDTWNQIWNIKDITIDGAKSETENYKITVNKIVESKENHDAVLHSAGGNTFKNLTIDLSKVNKGNAQGIRAIDAGANDTIDNVTIKGGKNVSYGITAGKGCEKVTVKNSNISDCGHGVYLEGAENENVEIKNNTFDACDYAAILYSKNSTFEGNTVKGGKVNIMHESNLVQKNTFMKDDKGNASRVKFYTEGNNKTYKYNKVEGVKAGEVGVTVAFDKKVNPENVDISLNNWGRGIPSKNDLMPGVSIDNNKFNNILGDVFKNPEDVDKYLNEENTPSTPSIPSKPSKPVYDHTKIEGLDRYETAAKVADKLGSYDTVVLVNATSTMSDGLSAAGLAGKEDAAILLVKKDSIPKVTMDRLKKVKKVYIIGGEAAISAKVANEITAAKIKVERLGGKTRVETSELVAKKLGNYKKAFVVNGFKGEADAMSASSVAAREEAPIILTNGKSSSMDKKSGVNYYVVGGKAVMDNAIVDKYNAERISGDDRYETNREMVDEFYGASKTLYFASGETLVDALTASTISKDDGLVLVGRNSDNKILNKKNTIQVGGMKFDVDFEK